MDAISKACKVCGEHKPLPEFHVVNSSKAVDDPKRYKNTCGPCFNEKRNRKVASGEWETPSIEKIRAKELRRQYGISPDDYDAMYTYQRGRCGVCGTHQNELERRLHVDHDHNTGEVRGLLCSTCNAGLGQFKDDPELLEIAAEYLRLNGK